MTLTNVVVRALPFHCTTDVPTKLFPFKVNVNAPDPALTIFGDTDVSAGSGFVPVIVVGFVATSFAKFVSPPPETVAVFVTLAGAFASTFTVNVIAG